MVLTLHQSCLSAEEKNTYYTLGFRYFCKCNFRNTDLIDPWSGRYCIDYDINLFSDKETARAYNVVDHAPLYEIPPHTETEKEKEERRKKERIERKLKKEAKEKEKAEKEGFNSVEEYRKVKAKEKKIKNLENEIKALKEELEEKEIYLKKLLQ